MVSRLRDVLRSLVRDNFPEAGISRKARFTGITEVVESCQMCWKLHRMQHICSRYATNISMTCIGHFQSNLGMSFLCAGERKEISSFAARTPRGE